jgi:ATP-dependent Zn protease
MRFKQIVRFNWPFYGAALAVVAIAPAVIPRLPLAPWLRIPLYAGTGLVAMWLVASLVSSFLHQGETLDYSAFKSLLAQGQVVEVEIGKTSIQGKYQTGDGQQKAFTAIRVEDPDLATKLEVPQLPSLIVALQKVANRIFSGLVLAGLLIASAQLLPYWRGLGYTGFLVAAVLGLYMVVTIMISDRRRDR